MDRAIPNIRFRRILGYSESPAKASDLLYNEKFIKDKLVVDFRTRLLAISIFLFHFIENGTLGLLPEKSYFVYRNVRISDLILYGLTIYSIVCYKEIKEMIKSRSFLMAKILILYLLFEFGVSAVKYQFNVVEYFFRLKGIWESFLVLPYMLLLRRDGFGFFFKLIFPVAIISNILYILSALTGIAFLPDVSIIKQRLPGDIEVFRVYGGTFFGDFFYLGFIYYWITKKFKVWQLAAIVLFIIPHLLAFGRTAWAFFVFTIVLMVAMNSLMKKQFRILVKHIIILVFLGIVLIISFIKFIPQSDYYVDALGERLFQGQEDVKYSEGTYGARVLLQNEALVGLWMKSDMILGIGMHPMWVVRAETHEEQLYYNAFSDVAWPSVLAAYGIIGFLITAVFQAYYIIMSFRLIKKFRVPDVYNFLVLFCLANMTFDSFVQFSYKLFSASLWGLYGKMNFFVAVIVYVYVHHLKIKKENR